MTRKDLIEKIMKVAEHYKNGDLYATGAMGDIGILIDDYTETVVKNCSIPAVMGELTCDSCGYHPNVIYTTSKGRFCEKCKPAS